MAGNASEEEEVVDRGTATSSRSNLLPPCPPRAAPPPSRTPEKAGETHKSLARTVAQQCAAVTSAYAGKYSVHINKDTGNNCEISDKIWQIDRRLAYKFANSRASRALRRVKVRLPMSHSHYVQEISARPGHTQLMQCRRGPLGDKCRASARRVTLCGTAAVTDQQCSLR